MTTSLSELVLDGGFLVRFRDGSEARLQPLALGTARKLIKIWPTAFLTDPEPKDPQNPTAEELAASRRIAQERLEARGQIIELFADAYPEHIDKLSFGDLVRMAPDFFWSGGSAVVLYQEEPPTGTPSAVSTLPAGDNSPI